MYILGIRNFGYDNSCALMKDGKIVCAICEERITRQKRTKKFPIYALKHCLEYGNISLKNISHIVIPWNPAINLEMFNPAQSERNRFIPEILYSIPNYLINNFCDETVTGMGESIKLNNSKIDIHFLNHHMCHAAFAYYTADFNKAIIFSADAWGEKQTTLLLKAVNNKFEKIWDMEFPQSLGMFYETMTQFLGFRPQEDEWKVMGASAYGNRDIYKDKIFKLLYPTNDGKFEMDLTYFDYVSFTKKNHFSQKMIRLLGSNRLKEQRLTQRHYDIAAAVQYVFEQVLFWIIKHNYERGIENLCLAGGSAMNCVANGKIRKNTKYKNVHISFAPDDAGTSIGACYLFWNQHMKPRKINRQVFLAPYLSKDFNDEDILRVLNDYKLDYRILDDPEKTVAQYLSQGKIVAWFQGKMEFGQRALGNRSILADPRNKEMKDLVNKAVKYRESFRPFAPAILDEYGDEYFEDYEFVPCMEKALKFRKNKRELVPAVCHCDGTGRLQSVSKSFNHSFWKLIEEFRRITGIPIVLNTSFNLNGEPIVFTVKDAVRTFYSCGLDIMIAGKYLLQK